MVLFRTVHGSRLYGLSHADSDDDFYTVVSPVQSNKKHYSKHSVVDGVDTTTVDLPTFINYATIGVPQALEAMFSTMAEVDEISALRAGFYVGTKDVYDRYLRTIKSFALDGSYKAKRHALRLAVNLNEMMSKGRFNPTLRHDDIQKISSLAAQHKDVVYSAALDLAWR